MEKLIKLLNKHRVELAHGNLQNQLMRHYNGYVFGLGDLNIQNCVLLIISKEYGFIKWLVDNDKIDLDIVREKLGTPCFTWYKKGEIVAVKDVEDYEQVLMLLSISDTPIEDLIRYLK